MPIIAIGQPSPIDKPSINQVETGTNLLDWITSNFESQDELTGGLSATILLNGKVIFESDNDDNVRDQGCLLDVVLGSRDQVSIVIRPAGVAEIGLGVAIVGLVAAVAALLLMPSLPGQEQQRESPNNRLNAASNSFRPGEAQPDIFGEVTSYPDFLQNSTFEYVNNRKVVRELFAVGRGSYEKGVPNSGDTSYDSIPGNTYQWIEPGEAVPAEYRIVSRESDQVDGQVCVAPDDESVIQENVIDTVTADGVSNTFLTVETDSTLVDDMSLAIGEYIRLDMPAANLNGDYEIANIDLLNPDIIYLNSTDGTSGSGNGTIARIDEDGELLTWVGWYELEGNNAEEVWIHWQMPQGARSDEGKSISVTVEAQIQKVDSAGDPIGSIFMLTEQIKGKLPDAQFRTIKFNSSTSPGVTAGKWQARIRRLTDNYSSGAADQVKAETFVSITPYTQYDYSDLTVLASERVATTFAVSQSSSKINADVIRKLPVYNRLTGEYDQSTLVATRDFADAVAYNIIVLSGRDISTVDMAGLYAINDGLDYPALGYFDFTFDDDSVLLGERVQTACTVARVAAYREYGSWLFSREEEKPFPVSSFTKRIRLSDGSAKQGWQPQRADDADSVSISYVDPDDNVELTIHRRIDLTTGEILSDRAGDSPMEITLAGCRSLHQASNRIDLEIRKLLHIRRTVADNVMRDGILPGLHDRVSWADPNDENYFDGEILGVNGDIYDTSDAFYPETGVDYVVYVTDSEGYPSNVVACTPRPDTDFGFVAPGLSGVYLAAGDDQMGSRYFIADALGQSESDFTLQSRIPSSGQEVEINLAEYKPIIFEMDGAGPPIGGIVLTGDLFATGISTIGDPAESIISVNTDGTIALGGGLSETFAQWHSGSGLVSDRFEVKLTLQSGDAPTGQPLGEWIEIDQSIIWRWDLDGAIETQLGADLQIEVREMAYPENTGTSDVTALCRVGGLLQMPASISSFNVVANGTAIAGLRLNSDGTWNNIGSVSGSGEYVAQAAGAGAQYETRLINTLGDLSDTGWIVMSPSSVEYFLATNSGEVSGSGDVEIREIANPANMTTTALTVEVISGPILVA